MTLEEKRNLIKEYKEPAQKAIEKYLDSLYDRTDPYFDEKGNFLSELPKNEKVENFIRSLREDAVKYESIRHKIIKGDFNLSLYEINLIGACFIYIMEVWKKHIEQLTKAGEEMEKLYKNIVSSES